MLSPSLLIFHFRRVAWLILYCARRTRPFIGRAFREQEDNQATLPPLLYFFFGKG